METKENIELGKKEYVNIYFLTSKDADVSFSKKKKTNSDVTKKRRVIYQPILPIDIKT